MKRTCSVTGILKVCMGLLHYCTFVLDAVNDAQNVRYTQLAEKMTTNRIYQK